MYIERLTLKNFRGARALQIEMHKHVNVFVGLNGSGKSTLLDAAALLLSWLANRIIRDKSSGRPISDQDISNGAPRSKIELLCNHEDNAYTWSLTKTRKGHAKSKPSFLSELTQFVRTLQNGMEDQPHLPILAYYPVNRAVIDIPLRIRSKHTFDIFSTYDDSLTSGANFRTFFEWFREREDLENEKKSDFLDSLIEKLYPTIGEEPKKEYDTQLQSVRNALSLFMPGFSDLTVKRSPLRMIVTKNGEELTVNQLSDGEKILMAMIGDLARRLAIANPELSNPLEGEGIVLIDEIDLHLHPKWQRMVVSNLHNVFPNCQFLLSTHSPHVITHVHPENLYLLKLEENNITLIRPTESYGKTVERVLEDLMDLPTTRPDDVSEQIKSIYDSIDNTQYDQAHERIQNLRKQIGNDPELVRASILIKRKELLGK